MLHPGPKGLVDAGPEICPTSLAKVAADRLPTGRAMGQSAPGTPATQDIADGIHHILQGHGAGPPLRLGGQQPGRSLHHRLGIRALGQG